MDVWWDLHELISRGHEQAEGRVVIDRLLSDLHDLTGALLHQILAKDRHKHGLNAVDFLDDECFAKSY